MFSPSGRDSIFGEFDDIGRVLRSIALCLNFVATLKISQARLFSNILVEFPPFSLLEGRQLTKYPQLMFQNVRGNTV